MTSIERQCLENVAELMATDMPGYYRSIHAWMMCLDGFRPPFGVDYRSAIIWC